MAFYVEDLWTSLCFLILEFVRNILDYYSLCPAQLASNSVRLIISFALLCRLIPIESRPFLFRIFFALQPHPKAKICGSLTHEKVFLSLPVFHRPSMDGRINSFLLLSRFLRIFLHAGVIQGSAPTRIVG